MLRAKQMPFADSLDKVIGVYIASVCRESFEYAGRTYNPRPLRVSSLIFRGYTCPARCGGCCPRFSLDYLPAESRPASAVPREAIVNRQSYLIFSDMQQDHRNHFCRYLDLRNGRCQTYTTRPFACDFELIRFIVPANKPIQLTQKLFGRGWAMRRVDGNRGARCDMTRPTNESVAEVTRKLARLSEWANYFCISTCLEPIIEWTKRGPHDESLFLPAP
jgi:hypothetical protein